MLPRHSDLRNQCKLPKKSANIFGQSERFADDRMQVQLGGCEKIIMKLLLRFYMLYDTFRNSKDVEYIFIHQNLIFHKSDHLKIGLQMLKH